MSRAQRCHRGWRGCLLSRAAIGSPSGCRGDRRHCLRHANSGTSRRGSTARVVPSRSVSPCRACVCLFFSRYPSLPRPRRPRAVFLFPAFATCSSFVLYLLPSPLLAKTGAPTSLALPSRSGLPLSRSTPPLSLALPPFPRTVAHRASLSLPVVSRPRRAPPSLPPPCSRTPAFLPRRRPATAASPARITPRPRERSVTTKVLVKS